MRIGDALLASEVRRLGIKRTNEFIRHEGKLARVLRDRDGHIYMWRDDKVVSVLLENGDCIYNSNGTVKERVGEPEPMKVREIDMTEKKEENKEKRKKRKEEEKKEEEGLAKVEILPSETDLEKADLLEARDIAENSDLVLQYSAPFRDKRTGKVEMRSWLGVNAWKLGLIEGYIKQGFSCRIQYKDTKEVRKCTITLKKGDQEIVSEGTYTKSRLRSFLHPARDECFDTFSFRNAIKRVVSLRDVVKAVLETQGEIQKMGALPTKKVED